jgi:N-acetylglucosamine-6-phosphate deacetylase
MGIDFNDATLSAEQLESAASSLLKTGVTRFFPTLFTGSLKKTSVILKTIALAFDQKLLAARMIGGVHLEGPFISTVDGPRGAHQKRYCREPDVELLKKWQELSGGHIRILTVAPELPGCIELIRECVRMGIIAGIGHTAADGDTIRAAVDNGARLSTHLGNGSHNMLPRHPNYIWDQLAEDRLFTSMIADGFHLPEAVLKVFVQCKQERAILVSDGMPLTGMEPGIYRLPAAGKVRLTSAGKLHLEADSDVLAGSASTLLAGIRHMMHLADFTFAWNMASLHPARLVNRSLGYGLNVGSHADLVLLDRRVLLPDPLVNDLKIRSVYKHGILYDMEG